MSFLNFQQLLILLRLNKINKYVSFIHNYQQKIILTYNLAVFNKISCKHKIFGTERLFGFIVRILLLKFSKVFFNQATLYHRKPRLYCPISQKFHTTSMVKFRISNRNVRISNRNVRSLLIFNIFIL